MPSPVNITLLIEVVAVVITASAFLFYWNRLLGSSLAWLITIYTSRYYNVWLSCGSLQISPLAGRVSFRDLEYHSSNISVRAMQGHITWRFWKFNPRQEGDTYSEKSKRSM